MSHSYGARAGGTGRATHPERSARGDSSQVTNRLPRSDPARAAADSVPHVRERDAPIDSTARSAPANPGSARLRQAASSGAVEVRPAELPIPSRESLIAASRASGIRQRLPLDDDRMRMAGNRSHRARDLSTGRAREAIPQAVAARMSCCPHSAPRRSSIWRAERQNRIRRNTRRSASGRSCSRAGRGFEDPRDRRRQIVAGCIWRVGRGPRNLNGRRGARNENRTNRGSARFVIVGGWAANRPVP